MGVLDDMTKGIKDRKAEAAGPSLTPVGVEAQPTKPSMVGIPDVPEVFLTNEAVADISRNLRRQAEQLVTVADALDKHTGARPADAFEVKLDKQAKRLVGKDPVDTAGSVDTKDFAADFAAKKAAAEASVYTSADADAEEPEAPTPATGWTCPDHGAQDLKQLTARRSGRTYISCVVPGCSKFERE